MAHNTAHNITVEVAVAAVERCAFTTHEERSRAEPCPTCGSLADMVPRSIVHTTRGAFGADWDTAGLIELIRQPGVRVGWAEHWLHGEVLVVAPPDESILWVDGVTRSAAEAPVDE